MSDTLLNVGRRCHLSSYNQDKRQRKKYVHHKHIMSRDFVQYCLNTTIDSKGFLEKQNQGLQYKYNAVYLGEHCLITDAG